MSNDVKSDVKATANVIRKGFAPLQVAVENYWTFEAFTAPDENGVRQKKWEVVCQPNMVTNEGLNNLLDTQFSSTTKSSWYVGLIHADTPTLQAADTLATHTWTEATTHDASTRIAVTFGTASSQSIDNSAAKSTFCATGGLTVNGAFLASTSTGNGGRLYATASFSGDKTLASAELLVVTVTCTAAAA